MDLQNHLRATFAGQSAAAVKAALEGAPWYLVVRLAPDADDHRYAISFSDFVRGKQGEEAWVRQCAGAIVDADDDHRVIAFAAPRSVEVVLDAETKNTLEAALGAPGDKAWYPYAEGFRALVYRWGGALRVSTSKSVDGERATYFRGSSSFASQLRDAARAAGVSLEDATPEGVCHAFVVQSPETPMVAPAPAPGLLLVGSVDLATLAPVAATDATLAALAPKWEPVGGSWDGVAARLRGALTPANLGAIVRSEPGPGPEIGGEWGLHAKVMHRDYGRVRDLVGRDQDADRRMLDVALHADSRLALLQLAPHLTPALRRADERIDGAVREVLAAYRALKCRGNNGNQGRQQQQQTQLPQPLYETIKRLHHGVYLARAKPRAPIDYGDADALVRSLAPRDVRSLLRSLL